MSVPQFGDYAPNPALSSYVAGLLGGGGFVQDELAPFAYQDGKTYETPKYKSALLNGVVDTKVSDKGVVNTMDAILPEFVSGVTSRHGLMQDIDKVQKIGGATGRVEPVTPETVAEDLSNQIRIGRENKVHAALVARASVSGYHATPTVKWDAVSGTITIKSNYFGCINAQRQLLGGECNTVVINPVVANVLAASSEMDKYRQGWDSSQLIAGGLPPVLWGKRVIVPGAMTNTAVPGVAQVLGDIWSEDSIYFCYANPRITKNPRTVTALVTNLWRPWGNFLNVYYWRDPNPMAAREWVGVDSHYEVDWVCEEAVYVLENILT